MKWLAQGPLTWYFWTWFQIQVLAKHHVLEVYKTRRLDELISEKAMIL